MNLKNILEKRANFLLVILLFFGFFLYYPIGDFTFLINFDDDQIILNPLNRYDLSFQAIASVFSESVYGLYHPITSLSWLIEEYFFGISPRAFHIDNILLHLLNVSLAYRLSRLLFKNKIIGLFVAFSFMFHPMNVENIAWMSGRKDLMYGLFFLAALIQYLHFKKNNKPYQYWICMLLFILSLLSKANAVALPLVLILLDWHLGERDWKKILYPKIPFFLLSGILLWITVSTQQAAGFIDLNINDYNFIDRIVLLLYSISHYLINLVLPLGLSPKNFYPIKEGNFFQAMYYIGLLILPLIVCFILKNKKHFLFGFLFFLLLMLPVLKLIPTGNDLVSNRYTYLAFLGLYPLLFFLAERLRTIGTLLLVIWMVFIAAKTREYLPAYEDSVSVWTAIIEQNEGNNEGLAMAHNERGQVYLKQGNKQLAVKDINQALKLKPNLYRGLLNRANIYEIENKLDLALKDLNKAVSKEKKPVEALRIRGVVFCKMNQAEKGKSDLLTAIELAPERADLYNNLGIAYSMLGEIENAENSFKKAIDLDKNYYDAFVNRGNFYLNTNQAAKAKADFLVAVKAHPNNYQYAYPLAKADMLLGDFESANKTLLPYQKNEMAAAVIGELLLRDGFANESLVYFSIAIGNDNARDKAFYQRSQAYKSLGQYQNQIDDLFAIVEHVPSAQVFFEIANAYEMLGNKGKACEFWHEADIRDHTEVKAKLEKFCN